MTQSTGLSRNGASFGNYEDIEQAVLETPRGRWFLTEYARRQRAQELAGLLRAMERLERALNVRAEPAADPVADRITRAIDTIDEARAAPPPLPNEGLEARQLKYFRKDEEIFAPAPPVRPVAVEAPPAPAEAEPRGAKLIIRHRIGDETLTPDAEAAVPAMPPPAPEAEAPSKRRIVIIRHKAGEAIDVPMHNELAETA